MSTRADFYIQETTGELKFLGSTSNSYYGDFETATKRQQYLTSIWDLLRENGSQPNKWYWPWKNSQITDEVFIFRMTPRWFNRSKGVLLTKVYTRGEKSFDELYFIKYSDRGNPLHTDEDGYTKTESAQLIKLPILKP